MTTPGAPPARSIWRRVGAWARLMRPLNGAVAVAGVILGGLLAAGSEAFQGPGLAHLIVAALSAALVGGGANALNDARDVSIDRVNRPARPIPSGAATVGEAMTLWAMASAVGVGLGVAVSPWHGAVAAASVGLLALYSYRLKPLPLVGNVAVATVVAVALVYGGRAMADGPGALVGAAFAFLTTLAREVAKDVEDAPGDAAAGLRTVPLAWGQGAAAALAAVPTGLALLLLPLPYVALGYRGAYLLATLPAAAALLAALRPLGPAATPADAARSSRALKGAMLAGIAALALGAPG